MISFFLGVLVNLHHPSPSLLSDPAFTNSVEEPILNPREANCGLVNLEAVQKVLAAKWAVDVINNQSLPHELKIGKRD